MEWGARNRRVLFLLGLVVVVAITVSAALASSPAGGAARLHAAGADCGKARWDIKTLNDPQNGEVDFHSDKVSVADLVGNKFERDKGTFSGKVRNKPAEFKTYKVDAQLVAFKRVAGDSDIHLIVADPSDSTKQMTVEFPHPECVLKADNASLLSQLQMTNAREALETACQKAPSNYVGLTGRATIKGVGFYDPPHHSKGGAPNGIELHPVLRFALASTSGPCNQFRLP